MPRKTQRPATLLPLLRHSRGYKVASLDKDYCEGNGMNFLESAGYAHLGSIYICMLFESCVHGACRLRCALLVAMNLAPAALVLLAPDCSSWSICSRSVSMRSYFNPLGCVDREFVQRGTLIVSRTSGLKVMPSRLSFNMPA